jgi:hypothetical protein
VVARLSKQGKTFIILPELLWLIYYIILLI